MGIPFACKISKHTWTEVNEEGMKYCKYCERREFVGIGVKDNTRCKLGFHSFEGKGKLKFCKYCGVSEYYTFWSSKNAGNWRGGEGGEAGGS